MQLKPLSIVYWSRVLFGIIAALICVAGWRLAGMFNTFLQGLTVAMIVYIITYYVFKGFFVAKVKKPRKVLTTGIGAYFLTWIAMWGLFFTLLQTL